jgi:hypothetical protein
LRFCVVAKLKDQREAKFMQNKMIEARYYNISRLAILLGIIIQGYCELNYIKLGNLFHFYWDLAVDLRWGFSCLMPTFVIIYIC